MFLHSLIFISRVYVILMLQIVNAGSCPVGSYILKDDSGCYWFIAESKTQRQSDDLCRKDNGLLAIIPSLDASEELKSLNFFSNLTATDRIWIGVNDKNREDVFQNSDGSPVSWTNWNRRHNQPNDKGPISVGIQDCVSVDDNGKWFDDDCSWSNFALCFKSVSSSSEVSSTQYSSEETKYTASTEHINSSNAITAIIKDVSITVTKETANRAKFNTEAIFPVIIMSVLAVVGAALTLTFTIIYMKRRKGHRQKQSKDDNTRINKNTETICVPKEYEEMENDATDLNNIVNLAAKYNEVYYSSTNDPFDSAYGDLVEGEYDALNQKRNKPNTTTDQIYSHTAEDTYDTTSHGRKVDNMDDTYDSTRHVDKNGHYTESDAYDSMSHGNRSVNYNDNAYDATTFHKPDDPRR